MIRLQRPTWIEAREILQWAHDPDPGPPLNADPNVWDLMITEWFADDKLYADLASKEGCPKRSVFLALLRERLRRRCSRTRWASETSDHVLAGISPARWTGNAKGRGRKDMRRARAKEVAVVAVEAESAARLYAEALLAIARTKQHPDLLELAARLEAFLADPNTIGDAFWAANP